MILTVTANPAWDVTYTVDALHPGDSHRVRAVTGQAGGKGVNVSRVLAQLGLDTVATGLVGGSAGADLVAELAGAGVPAAFLDAPVRTRSAVAVVDDAGTATVLNEPGPVVDPGLWSALVEHLTPLIAAAEVVVLAGSLPPGSPADAYAQLTALVHRLGRRCLVDADGPALAAALAAAPDLVKPNRAELLRATGAGDLPAAVEACLSAGVPRVVVTDGAAGMRGADRRGSWLARPPALTPVNPTGAGDAASAAFAVGLAAGEDWPDLLRRATAWSAAAVLHPRAGRLAADRIGELADRTTLEQVRPRTAEEFPC